MNPPPLSLYIHLPWCLRKCPYCDFNSHELRGDLPGDEYVSALLSDLESELPLVWGRVVHTVFIGGGTPSLFSPSEVERLLSGIRAVLSLSPGAEITLEANPGASEHGLFAAYRDCGVNRFSLGAQSFSDAALKRLGRIHGSAEVMSAVESLHRAGIGNFNLDLMYALPGQTLEQAVSDARTALSCDPAHVSHYQLTIEPNTLFHARPPVLPDDDLAWEMQDCCAAILTAGGYGQYEVSAWARAGRECRHNLNYWQYGDFVGIGAGAHGKLTNPGDGAVSRRVRKRHPREWMQAVQRGDAVAENRILTAEERVFEFFLNQLRLRRGVSRAHFEARTGLGWERVAERVAEAEERGWLAWEGELLAPTELGWRFGNEVQALFLP
jgi:oxygen-independent coproporphyrinogen-3 oxidase